MAELEKIVRYLDNELKASAFDDRSHNGLQVEKGGTVTRICCGVDASLEFFEAAHARGGDLLLVHHGISWGESLARISGLNYRRVNYLMERDMGLYACHLPLDAHPKHGNNSCIAKLLGLQSIKPFGEHRGMMLGVGGMLPKPVSLAAFAERVGKLMGNEVALMPYGQETVRSVAIVSGGAAGDIVEAAEAGYDVFLSGEPALVAYVEARDRGMNAVFAGHYATEKWGVMALGQVLAARFRVPWEFVDLEVPF